MPGFPARPDLATFGPDAVNTRAVRDPSRELDAATWNLLRFQVAGLGVISPRAYLEFLATAAMTISARAEAWNPRGLTSAPFTPPTITRVGTGNYSVVYASPVTDQAGASVALSFTRGMGFVVTPSAIVLKHVLVTPLVGSSNGVKVAVFNAAGALEDGSVVGILIG
jgi:hypothetical protein